MNLIFITRKVDRRDSRVGFVHDWLNALAAKLDRLYVICQEKGDTSGLADNVEIHSFGKDRGFSRPRQLITLYILLFTLSKNSKGVFAHMMPIYAIVAWLPAKLRGLKLVLWYMHKSVDLKLRIAEKLVDSIFTASKESFRLDSKKVNVVGHGIPVEKFKNKNPKFKNTIQKSNFNIVSVGRISKVKDYESLIKAIQILHNTYNIKHIKCDIYGDPALPEDMSYLQSLQQFVKSAGLSDHVFFRGGVTHDKVPQIYANSNLVVNMSQTGSLDKSVLEAAVSRIVTLTSNEAFKEIFNSISEDLFFERDNPKMMSEKIISIQEMSESARGEIEEKLSDWVSVNHNLENLITQIVKEFESK